MTRFNVQSDGTNFCIWLSEIITSQDKHTHRNKLVTSVIHNSLIFSVKVQNCLAFLDSKSMSYTPWPN